MIFPAILMILAAQAPDVPIIPPYSPVFPIFGPANTLCSKWNQEKLISGNRIGQAAYVSGFLTGVNMDNRANQTGDINAQKALIFIDDLCARNPNMKISDALNFLITEIHAKAIREGRRSVDEGL